VQADLALGTDERRATAAIFGSKPGAYGAGLLPLIDSRDWKTDADLAEVWAVWGGYAYGKGLDGRAARGDMERVYTRMKVAAKNQDTREHDIVDSDDYFQYHGGMVAAVRALTGESPEAYVGDSAVPDTVRPRRCRRRPTGSSGPGWSTRSGSPRCSGTATRGASSWPRPSTTCSATTPPPASSTTGCTRSWPRGYVFDETNRAFMQKSNPWALRGISERLLEAADRGLWEEPSAETLAGLQRTYLELEGDLEGD
jgi:cobaltochelatase CobN